MAATVQTSWACAQAMLNTLQIDCAAYDAPLSLNRIVNKMPLGLEVARRQFGRVFEYINSDAMGDFPTYRKWNETRSLFCHPEQEDDDGNRLKEPTWFTNQREELQKPGARLEILSSKIIRTLQPSLHPNGCLIEPPFRPTPDPEPLEDNTIAHHYNFNCHKVLCKSATPPAVSFWATTSMAVKHHAYGEKGGIRPAIITAQAAKFVDPYTYSGPLDLYSYTGTKLRDAATGYVSQTFTPYGYWQDEMVLEDEEPPLLMNDYSTDWSNGPAELDRKEGKISHYPDLPCPIHILPGTEDDISVNDDGRAHPPQLSKRKAVGVRSAMSICQNVDDVVDEELAMEHVEASLSGPLGQSPVQVEVTSIPQPPDNFSLDGNWVETADDNDWGGLDTESVEHHISDAYSGGEEEQIVLAEDQCALAVYHEENYNGKKETEEPVHVEIKHNVSTSPTVIPTPDHMVDNDAAAQSFRYYHLATGVDWAEEDSDEEELDLDVPTWSKNIGPEDTASSTSAKVIPIPEPIVENTAAAQSYQYYQSATGVDWADEESDDEDHDLEVPTWAENLGPGDMAPSISPKAITILGQMAENDATSQSYQYYHSATGVDWANEDSDEEEYDLEVATWSENLGSEDMTTSMTRSVSLVSQESSYASGTLSSDDSADVARSNSCTSYSSEEEDTTYDTKTEGGAMIVINCEEIADVGSQFTAVETTEDSAEEDLALEVPAESTSSATATNQVSDKVVNSDSDIESHEKSATKSYYDLAYEAASNVTVGQALTYGTAALYLGFMGFRYLRR